MISGADIYLITASVLFCRGLYTLLVAERTLRRILAVNVMGSSVFLSLIAAGEGAQEADPVPRAMVITGIVVAVSATALALNLMLKLAALDGDGDPHEEPQS